MSLVLTPEVKEILNAFSEDLRDLAALQSCEPSAEVLVQLREIDFPNSMGIVPQSDEGRAGAALVAQGIAGLPSSITDEVLDTLAADFADIFLNYTFGASPCGSVWLDEDGLALQEPTFQVRSFYKRFNLKAANWRTQSDDHLVSELEFLSFLLRFDNTSAESVEKETERVLAAADFLDEHMLRWVGRFSERVEKRAATRFFAGLAKLTSAMLEETRCYLENILDQPRPSAESIERKMRPEPLVKIGAKKYFPGSEPSW